MIDIDYSMLLNSILDAVDDNLHPNYDWDKVLLSAEPCWDDTAVKVVAKDFKMVFDLISYELLDYEGDDVE